MAHDDFIPSDDDPEEIDHGLTDNIVCPHCGNEIEESWEFDGECGEDECDECGKPFKWVRNVEITYSTEKLEE